MFSELKHQVVQLVQAADRTSNLTYVSIGVGLTFAFLFFKIMFGAPGSFREDLDNARKRYWWERSYWERLFDGNHVDRQWSKLKIFIWLALSVAGGWAAHHKLPELFPNLFR